jgi:hypothetical protein
MSKIKQQLLTANGWCIVYGTDGIGRRIVYGSIRKSKADVISWVIEQFGVAKVRVMPFLEHNNYELCKVSLQVGVSQT